MKKFLILATLFCTICVLAETAPNTIIYNGEKLLETKMLMDTNKQHQDLKKLLISNANEVVDKPIRTVIEKKILPPSGNKNDLFTLAIYWWPNPDTADGFPYIRKDGQTNPESQKDVDAGWNVVTMFNNVKLLSLAAFYTGDERYEKKAAEYLRAWFVTPETRVNPNCEYTDVRRGHNYVAKNNYPGLIIFSLRMHMALDGAALLKGSKYWTEEDDTAFKQWLAEYSQWLTTSELGKYAKMSKNNHATYYASQLSMIYLYLDEKDKAKAVLEEFFNRAMSEQFEANGIQEKELERTLAFSYSTMNMCGWTNLAQIGKHCGFDAWSFKTSDGIGLFDGLSFFTPYSNVATPWPYQNIKKISRSPLWQLMVLGAENYQDQKFVDSLKELDSLKEIQLEKLYFPYNFK